MSVTEATISSGESYPKIRAIAGLTSRYRPWGLERKMPSTACSKMPRYCSSAAAIRAKARRNAMTWPI